VGQRRDAYKAASNGFAAANEINSREIPRAENTAGDSIDKGTGVKFDEAHDA